MRVLLLQLMHADRRSVSWQRLLFHAALKSTTQSENATSSAKVGESYALLGSCSNQKSLENVVRGSFRRLCLSEILTNHICGSARSLGMFVINT